MHRKARQLRVAVRAWMMAVAHRIASVRNAYVIKIPWGNDGKPGLVRLDRRHWHCMEESNAPPYERIG
jgi:hypothetical protein